MHFLLLILFFFLFILLLGVGIISSIFRFLFGKRRPTTFDPNEGQQQTGRNRWSGQSTSTSTGKKVFADDEGEYIDFEEVKDK